MKEIEKDKPYIVQRIDYNLKKGNSRSYDKALEGILELRDLAQHKNENEEFEQWLQQLKESISSKRSMIQRLKNKGL